MPKERVSLNEQTTVTMSDEPCLRCHHPQSLHGPRRDGIAAVCSGGGEAWVGRTREGYDETKTDSCQCAYFISLAVGTLQQATDATSCDATGPFVDIRCTEPEGHSGSHQYHADGARASWQRGG